MVVKVVMDRNKVRLERVRDRRSWRREEGSGCSIVDGDEHGLDIDWDHL